MAKKIQVGNAKRIVAVTNAKGGVGKSKTAIGLADYYTNNGVHAKFVDADSANKRHGSFKHVFPDAEKIDIRSARGLDAVIDLLFQDNIDLVLVDMGGGAIDELAQWFKEIAVTLHDAGVKLTVCSPLTNEMATFDSLLRITEAVGSNADYVVVRNNGKGDTSGIERLNVYKDYVAQVQPAVITLEMMRPDIAEALDLVGVSPAAALKASKDVKGELLSSASARIRLMAWNNNLAKQIDGVTALLP
jgi:cellulose biosynthesis protein BcsQ